jgi:hypothetical protein
MLIGGRYKALRFYRGLQLPDVRRCHILPYSITGILVRKDAIPAHCSLDWPPMRPTRTNQNGNARLLEGHR